jgi:glycosyltransferase involved in cell wall biosynthesis
MTTALAGRVPTRVLFILPSLRAGGAETQTVDLVNGILPGVSEKYLLCFDPGLDLRGRLDEAQVELVVVPRTKKFDLRVARRIARLIDERGIDVVHCSLMISLFWGWLGIQMSRRRPPLVAALHTTVNATRRADVFDLLVFQWLLKQCARVIFVCHAQQAHWVRKMPSLAVNSTVVHNGVDTYRFKRGLVAPAASTLRERLSLHGRKVIVHIAGFRPEKGHSLLVDAFAELCRQSNDSVLVFAGDGVLRNEIEDKVRYLGLVESTRFLGVVPDVRPVLEIADCSVIPSAAESFSMAMLESLAMEVPVVTTDVGGLREAVIQGTTGLIVPAHDRDALAEALRQCLADDDLRRGMGHAGRELVGTQFERLTMLQKTGDILLNVISSKVSGRMQ